MVEEEEEEWGKPVERRGVSYSQGVIITTVTFQVVFRLLCVQTV